MALHHHDFELQLRDAEKLRLFIQSRISDQEASDASLKEAQLSSRHWELEAKEATKRVVRAETERDAARHEAAMARLKIDVVSGAQAQVEVELAYVRDALVDAEDARLKADSKRDAACQALVTAEEARRKAKEENGRLTDERLSLVMELEAIKDDFMAFREKTSVEKVVMEAKFDASSDVIFNYGYDCCAFAHNICGSEPLIPTRMLDTSTLHLSFPMLSLSRLLGKICQPRVSRLLGME